MDKGTFDKPDYVTVGYLPHRHRSFRQNTLCRSRSAFGDILQLQEKIAKADEAMLEMDTDSEAYYDLIDAVGEWEQQLKTSNRKR